MLNKEKYKKNQYAGPCVVNFLTFRTDLSGWMEVESFLPKFYNLINL